MKNQITSLKNEYQKWAKVHGYHIMPSEIGVSILTSKYQIWKEKECKKIDELSSKAIKHLELIEKNYDSLFDFIKFLYGKKEFRSLNLRNELLTYPNILYDNGSHHIRYRLMTLINHKLIEKISPGHYKVL